MNLLDLIFPKRCVTCGRMGKYICTFCRKKIKYIEKQICCVCEKQAIGGLTHPKCQTSYTMDGFYASTHFRGPTKDVIHLLKYRLVSKAVHEIIPVFFSYKPIFFDQVDFFVPVPLFVSRERERGFNQSALIARALGKCWDKPVASKILKRKRNTKPQADLEKKARRINILGAFVLTGDYDLSGKKVAIIDDVSTTRATLLECAKVLKRAGAEKVYGIVLAHG